MLVVLSHKHVDIAKSIIVQMFSVRLSPVVMPKAGRYRVHHFLKVAAEAIGFIRFHRGRWERKMTVIPATRIQAFEAQEAEMV